MRCKFLRPIRCLNFGYGQRSFLSLQMMMHAWNNYKAYAWGMNELSPEVKLGDDGVFPGTKIGLTIADSLDTLWLMGEFEEVKLGKTWLLEHLAKGMNVVSLKLLVLFAFWLIVVVCHLYHDVL